MSEHELNFLHFNDVYHVSKRDNIARFMSHLQILREQLSSKAHYTVFSGDAFSPSLEASILKGAHMLPLLEELQIDVACAGNHDFDFGQDRLRELTAKTSFPWLLSNATQPNVNLLSGTNKYHIAVLQGFKVGFIGLAGTDWPSNCRELPICTIAQPVDAARRDALFLRRVENCDFVVAISHMRVAEDIQLSEELYHGEDSIDLILGGHDHDVLRRYKGECSKSCLDPSLIDCSMSNDAATASDSATQIDIRGPVRIVKSGTDWNGLSCVNLKVNRAVNGAAYLTGITVKQFHDIQNLPIDSEILAQNRLRVDECLKEVDEHIMKLGSLPLVHCSVALEGTSLAIRSRESNLCNMLGDMVRSYYEADIAFVNSGSVRCDRIIPATTTDELPAKDPLTVRDLMDILPFDNALVVKHVSSAALITALENAFSDSHTDGRFLHFAGLTVVADWEKPEGSRVCELYYTPLDGATESPRRIYATDEKCFRIAMVAFIADGFDGYSCLEDQQTLIDEESAMTDTQLLLRTFGYWSHKGNDATVDDDDDDEGIVRSRRSIVSRSKDGIPVVGPQKQGRIAFRPMPLELRSA